MKLGKGWIKNERQKRRSKFIIIWSRPLVQRNGKRMTGPTWEAERTASPFNDFSIEK